MNDGQKVLNGEEVKSSYVDGYLKSHTNRDMNYKISYTYYYYLDSLIDYDYILLDIGTGTGGGHG